MIQNQRQYNVTRAQVSKLQAALGLADESKAKMDPRIYAAMIAGIESQIADLQHELLEYENLAAAPALDLHFPDQLPDILIKARVARGYNHQKLAEKLNVRPQQIQKYEASAYQSASLKRILEIAKALDISFEAQVPLTAAGRAAEHQRRLGAAPRSRFVTDPGCLKSSTGVDIEFVGRKLAMCEAG
jgi:transcriptional regulator with XRE-family HTH domain